MDAEARAEVEALQAAKADEGIRKKQEALLRAIQQQAPPPVYTSTQMMPRAYPAMQQDRAGIPYTPRRVQNRAEMIEDANFQSGQPAAANEPAPLQPSRPKIPRTVSVADQMYNAGDAGGPSSLAQAGIAYTPKSVLNRIDVNELAKQAL